MSEPNVTMLPTPREAFYEWGDPPRRETFTVIGVAITEPERADAAAIYNATWLLVIRADGKPTWFGLRQLQFVVQP